MPNHEKIIKWRGQWRRQGIGPPLDSQKFKKIPFNNDPLYAFLEKIAFLSKCLSPIRPFCPRYWGGGGDKINLPNFTKTDQYIYTYVSPLLSLITKICINTDPQK